MCSANVALHCKYCTALQFEAVHEGANSKHLELFSKPSSRHKEEMHDLYSFLKLQDLRFETQRIRLNYNQLFVIIAEVSLDRVPIDSHLLFTTGENFLQHLFLFDGRIKTV